ncbi:universal stress protein [Fibrella sp. HMF5335]|uniref:Universal stress protein n=1 Tax=Fibrella rubiginis TaxID=2817060 RepID=A0A939GCH4_9BACT|nr:universal stress protein [Fibrella rubiginis]MBO0935806.1 universal stress protein [Fibrella rubiginis]
MKTILVPTDLSPLTVNALAVTVTLARPMGANIILLHSVAYPMPMPAYAEAFSSTVDYTMNTYADIEQDARDTLNQLANNPAYADVTIRPVLLTNGHGVVDNVTDQPADLIVMASEGASGLNEWLVGSNAEAIVRYAHCPVLVIKKPVPHFQPRNIVCAIDVDERLNTMHPYPFQLGEQGLNQFLYVMTPTDNRDPAGIRDWVDAFALRKGISRFSFVIRPAKTVPEGIINHAREVGADLIVLYTHGHTGLRHLLTGSVAEDVVNHADVPVLIMRA